MDSLTAGVLCVGNANVDTYLPKNEKFFGGSAANTAVRLADLSQLDVNEDPSRIRPALLAVVGSDANGQAIRENLKMRGVVTKYLAEFKGKSQQSTIALERGGERVIGRGARQVEVLCATLRKIVPVLPPDIWVHVKAPSPVFAAIVEEGTRLGSLDLASFERREDWERLGLLLQVKVVTGNEQEVTRLGDLEVLWRNPTIELVALKEGERGATLFTRDSPPLHVPPYRVTAVDKTGAGDAFNAGIIFGIRNKWDLRHIGDLANALGALTCTVRGAQNPPVTRNSLEEIGFRIISKDGEK